MSEEKNIPEDKSTDNISQSTDDSLPAEQEREEPKEEHLQAVTEYKSSTTNSKSETETMEVHHHGHVHEKKKWKEYVFQFFMLFLAVTAGFFVENQREHYVENQRARQYAGLLIADMKRDTTFFNKEDIRLLGLQGRFDTLISLLRQTVPASNAFITNQLLRINYVSDARVITATYNQMKTSGSLRYIKNTGLIEGLQEYYEIQLPRCIRSSESSLAFFQEYILSFFIDKIRERSSHRSDTLQKKNTVIIGRSMDSDQRLSNIIEKAQTILMIANGFYKPANKKAAELIGILKKEYHLK